jgi:ABC-type nitrate/sulfonate/bicarbonate transport system substrate-binding protein
MLEALEQGRADGATIANPILQDVLASGKARSIGAIYDALGSGFLEAGWFCSESYAARNADAVRRFFAAMREAATYTNVHHDETIDLLAAYAKLPAAVIRTMNRDTIATSLQPAAIQPCIDAAYKYGYIASPFRAGELLVS